jgi:hypothetical protein
MLARGGAAYCCLVKLDGREVVAIPLFTRLGSIREYKQTHGIGEEWEAVFRPRHELAKALGELQAAGAEYVQFESDGVEPEVVRIERLIELLKTSEKN